MVNVSTYSVDSKVPWGGILLNMSYSLWTPCFFTVRMCSTNSSRVLPRFSDTLSGDSDSESDRLLLEIGGTRLEDWEACLVESDLDSDGGSGKGRLGGPTVRFLGGTTGGTSVSTLLSGSGSDTSTLAGFSGGTSDDLAGFFGGTSDDLAGFSGGRSESSRSILIFNTSEGDPEFELLRLLK